MDKSFFYLFVDPKSFIDSGPFFNYLWIQNSSLSGPLSNYPPAGGRVRLPADRGQKLIHKIKGIHK